MVAKFDLFIDTRATTDKNDPFLNMGFKHGKKWVDKNGAKCNMGFGRVTKNTPNGGAPEEWGPEGWGAKGGVPKGGRPKFRAFFPSPAIISLFFVSLWVSSR